MADGALGNTAVHLGNGTDSVSLRGNSTVFLAPGAGTSQVTDNSTGLTAKTTNASSSLSFNHGSDARVVLDHTGFGGIHSLADVMLADNGSGGTTLSLGNGTTVQFSNVAPAQLDASHVRFG